MTNETEAQRREEEKEKGGETMTKTTESSPERIRCAWRLTLAAGIEPNP